MYFGYSIRINHLQYQSYCLIEVEHSKIYFFKFLIVNQWFCLGPTFLGDKFGVLITFDRVVSSAVSPPPNASSSSSRRRIFLKTKIKILFYFRIID